eukprot:2636367-Rhodomonas_salina.1
MPQQTNGYDCGLYLLLTAQVWPTVACSPHTAKSNALYPLFRTLTSGLLLRASCSRRVLRRAGRFRRLSRSAQNPICLCNCYEMPSTELSYLPMQLLRAAQYRVLSPYANARYCAILSAYMHMLRDAWYCQRLSHLPLRLLRDASQPEALRPFSYANCRKICRPHAMRRALLASLRALF